MFLAFTTTADLLGERCDVVTVTDASNYIYLSLKATNPLK
jgi:hypothetical protein